VNPAIEKLESLSPRGMKLGLDAIRALLARMGNPERESPHVLVGGTNGKGSTAATLSAIFRAAGIRAGLHTSPHLVEVTERVRIGDADVSDAGLAAALEAVFAAAAGSEPIPVTYFEAVTAAAESAFRSAGCRAAVVEVGLGGRLDATNASEPVLSAVTSIDLDHTADLGETRGAIAREKAGIFRPGRPALSGATHPEARAVLQSEAERIGARFLDVPAAVRMSGSCETADGQAFRLETPHGVHRLETPLRGAHQAANVAVAVVAAEHLRTDFPELTPGAIEAGVAATRWPGRLERIEIAGRAVWLDGCHNPEGARALAAYWAGLGIRPALLFGVMRDKDARGIAAEIFPAVRRVVLVAPAVERAAPAEELRRRLGGLGSGWETADSAEAGLALLLDEPGEILVAGSLYLVGEIRRQLARERDSGRAIA